MFISLLVVIQIFVNVTTNKLPLLSTIEYPSDLRKLPIEKLPQVCKELRTCLIDELSRNPGHFASSLGVIELTVALHYVFNTPEDRIVWDVGHQAYGHHHLRPCLRKHLRRTRYGSGGKATGNQQTRDCRDR